MRRTLRKSAILRTTVLVAGKNGYGRGVSSITRLIRVTLTVSTLQINGFRARTLMPSFLVVNGFCGDQTRFPCLFNSCLACMELMEHDCE